jgi:hypothetical protein
MSAILKMSYSEIMDQDFTAVDAKVLDEKGNLVAHFRNHSPGEAETYSNQVDTFPLPTAEIGLEMLRNTKGYCEVALNAVACCTKCDKQIYDPAEIVKISETDYEFCSDSCADNYDSSGFDPFKELKPAPTMD